MYKRRVKRTVSASPVVTTQDSKSQKEPIVIAKKTSSSSLQSSQLSVSKDLQENPLRENQQKKDRTVQELETSQDAGARVGNMRFVSQNKQTSYFEKILLSCGFDIHAADGFAFCVDHAIFVRNLKTKLERSANFPLNVIGPNGFLQGFEEFCNDPQNIKEALQKAKPSENGKRKNFQMSLMHSLLSVECLQKRLIEFLCEKLVDFTCLDHSEKPFPWTQMILNQFKFLDTVVDPDAFLNLLFDVLHSIPEKGDVLACLPDLIQDSQHEEAASKLSELLVKDREMRSVTPSILEALTDLMLPPELQKSVSENVMKCLGSVPLDHLPSMVRFLVTGADSDEMPKLVSSFRQHLDFTSPLLSSGASSSTLPSSSRGPSTVENCELLTVEVLKWAVLVSRSMAEAWLDAIKSIHSASRHCPLDIIVLLLLYAEIPDARPSVQALFRNKARQGLFREKLLATTFSTMLVVIQEYLKTLMKILFVLLKSPDPAVVDHASCWYKLCLLHLPSWQAQTAVHQLLLHVSTSSPGTMQAALSVLAALALDHLDTLLPHQWLLLNLLDKVPHVEVNVVEMIMEILCRVAFGSDTQNGSAMNDNILMLVRKQRATWSSEVRKKGVVGAIVAAKHMAAKDADQSVSAAVCVKQAIDLMVLVTGSTENFPDVEGLFLDKLSSMLCSVEVLDESFVEWVNDYIGTSFTEKYVVPKKDLKAEEDLKLMFSLEAPEQEEEEDVCLPLAHLVDRDCFIKRCQYTSVVVMPASLRLMRCVKCMSCEGDLSNIAALLVCPVLMPRSVEEQESIEFSFPQEQNFLLDCLFHCINWFRELVSAFAYQKDPELRKYVLLRLQDLVSLQKKLACWLNGAVDYIPPPCQFFTVGKPPKPPTAKKLGKPKGKKRKKSIKKGKKKLRTSELSESTEEGEKVEEVEEEEEEEEEEGVDLATVETKGSKFSSDLAEFRGFLREMDVDVVILLKEPVVLHPSKTNVHQGLSPAVLQFLLQDLTAKVEYLLASEAKRISPLKAAGSKPVGFANLETFPPRSFARNTIKILPALIDKLETIGEYFQSLLDQSDNIRDAPCMFPENSSDIKRCYSYLLRILAGLFSWNGFESKINAEYLKDALRLLVARDNAEVAEKQRIQGLLVEAAAYLQSFTERTLQLSAACSLVKVLHALIHLADGDAAIRRHVENACKHFLSQRWYDLRGCEEKGAEFNHCVDTLLKAFFSSLGNKLETVTGLVPVVYQELEICIKLGSKEWSLTTFPTVTKSNFVLLYRALCSALIQGTEEMLEEATDVRVRFKVWQDSLESLRGLMMIVRLQNTRSNLVSFVKNSLRLLKVVLKRGLPLFAQSFRNKANEVTSVLQTLQKSTRFLNSVCYHSKSTKDIQLTSLVPALRLVLEQIVVSVRSMLAMNNCRDAFWIGVLKNRNLKGEEVLSQQSESTVEENQDEEDEDLPSDDDSDVDVDLDNAAEHRIVDKDDSESSLSTVF